MSIIVHGRTAPDTISATIDGVLYSVPDHASNPIRAKLGSEWEAKGHVIPAYEAPAASSVERISKNAIWERATNTEAEQMEAALAGQPVRIRRIYEGATHISTDHELFTLLDNALTALFGKTRAAQLLAPTD